MLFAILNLYMAALVQVINPKYQPASLNHVVVTTIEELDQGSLHSSIKHSETEMSRLGLVPPTSFTAAQAGTLPTSFRDIL
jgi:hypothetical protein